MTPYPDRRDVRGLQRYIEDTALCSVCGVTRPGTRFVRFVAGLLRTAPVMACGACARVLGARHALDFEVVA